MRKNLNQGKINERNSRGTQETTNGENLLKGGGGVDWRVKKMHILQMVLIVSRHI